VYLIYIIFQDLKHNVLV